MNDFLSTVAVFSALAINLIGLRAMMKHFENAKLLVSIAALSWHTIWLLTALYFTNMLIYT